MEPWFWPGVVSVFLGGLIGSLIAGVRRKESPRQLAVTAGLSVVGGGIAVLLIGAVALVFR